VKRIWKAPEGAQQSLPSQSRTLIGAPPPVRVVVALRCTVKDQDFAIHFRANGLTGDYFVERVVATSASTPQPEGAAAPQLLHVPVHQLPIDNLKCPHCKSSARPMHCGVCNRFVCRGRMKKDFFHCSDSCGNAGPVTGTFADFMAQEGRPPPSLSAPPAAPRIGNPSTKLLGRKR
jgi:hypothetical protein